MKNKKKLKGFTLIELIIVLAIFGLILTVIMSLIDPVSKVMKKATTRERTAAYADNICEYITNSLTYAKYMDVYDGDFFTKADDGTQVPMSGTTMEDKEKEAAKILVADVLNDAVDENKNPVNGQVRILKFINTPDVDGDGIDDYEEGQIYESVYSFTAGHKAIMNDSGVELVEEKEPIIGAEFSSVDRPVVNPEHLEEYCYYYERGFFTLDPITDPENYSDRSDEDRSFEAIPVDYYSCLNPIKSRGSRPEYSLNINVISYQRDDEGGLANKISGITHKIDADTEEEVMLFRSPAYLNSASMALINIQKVALGTNVIYMMPERDDSGQIIPDGGFRDPEPGEYGYVYDRFELDDPDTYSGAVKDNIYVVYIMPNEMSDIQIVLNSNSSAPDVT